MLAVLSPAKSLCYEREQDLPTSTQPRLADQTNALVLYAQGMSVERLMARMGISKPLAELNHGRWQHFHEQPAKPAIQVFDGDVYTGLDAQTMSRDDVEYAQQTLRILSGLYGVLRPLDEMRPYRLEMGTKSFPGQHKLSIWWEDAIAHILEQDLAEGEQSILNLASQEYWAAVKGRLNPNIRVVDVEFLAADGRFITMHAKVARGSMARWMINNRVQRVDDMKGYDADGYRYDRTASSENRWVFQRQA